MNKESGGVAGAWFALLLIAYGLHATAADVSLKGSLLDNTCLFEQEDAALEVAFPTRALKYFEQYGRTETESFAIGLKNCSAITQGKTVALSFTFPQSQVVNGTPMLTPSGDTGLVIGLVDGTGNAIVPDHPVEVGVITQTGPGNVNRYTLGAYVMAPPGVTVTAGQYSATANFTVSYR
ncbi:fimbrial protein [Salmonella enterica]|uniref:fimbrial protein n=1 Tax=Salmonella enterica TaxID=28901 RepID=UPI000FBC9B8F|nr:type 1 fimbrial protein [Salmonella enterica subsp. enterica serovar Napoli]MLQ56510.1 type 1 fimbrial protein [Salmonella enterica subsp. enterica serovar Napoli]